MAENELQKLIKRIFNHIKEKYGYTDEQALIYLQGYQDCAEENQQSLERRDKMLRDTVAELCEAKRLLKAAVEDIRYLINHAKRNGKACDRCKYGNEMYCYADDCSNDAKWQHEAEALALIGEDTNVPASKDGDTNVGHKSGGWISCKDKMPEDNTSVLFVYVSENGIKSVHYGYHQTLKGLGSSWAKPSGGWQYCDDDITHWQPLPEPPKDGDTNG